MISKEVETFQLSIKLHNLAQSIAMMIVGFTVISFLISSSLILLLGGALFGIMIYSLVRYILYLNALKAVRTADPDNLFTKTYLLEKRIFKIIIGCLIASIIVSIFLIIFLIGPYIVVFFTSIIPIIIIFFLLLYIVLFCRAYIEMIGIALGFLIRTIYGLISHIQIYGGTLSTSWSYIIEILLLIIFLCTSILIVIYQFKLNRLFFQINQSLGIQIKLSKFKEKELKLDLFYNVEYGIHLFGGTILVFLLILDINIYYIFDVFLIPTVLYLFTAVIMLIGVKFWANIVMKEKMPAVTTTISTPSFTYCSNCGYKLSENNAKFCSNCGHQIVK